jgi:hypothetical protein
VTLTPEQQAELATLRAAERDRLDAEDAEETARELEELKLAKQIAEETGGRRGRDFEVVNTEHGVFGVRKPEFDQVKRWNKISDRLGGGKAEPDDLIPVLRDHIIGKEKALAFHAAAAAFPGIINEVSRGFMRLMGITLGDSKKK